MNARQFLLAPLFLITASAPAQTYLGEPPQLFRPLAMDATMAPATFGLAMIEGMACRREASGDYYFALCGRQSRISALRLSAWRRNGTTGAWTRLPDFDATTQDGDQQVTLTADLLGCAVFTAGAGVTYCERATTSAAWGARQAITGLPADAYSPSFATFESVGLSGQDGMLHCTSNPGGVWAVHFDRKSRTASNRRRIVKDPAPGTHYTSVVAIDDLPLPVTKKSMFLQRSNAGFQQRCLMTANLKTDTRDMVVFDSPRDNVLGSFCHLGGGSFRATCMGIPGRSQFPDCVVSADLVHSCDSSASPSRQVDMVVWGPQRGSSGPLHAILLVGVLGNAGIPIYGITGSFGLAPTPLVVLPAQELQAETGRAAYSAIVGSGVHGSCHTQPLIWDRAGTFVLGGTQRVDF